MDERRKLPRKNLMSYSQVHELHNGKLIGYLGDLNLLGAMVISDQSIKTETELSISIELPEIPNTSDPSMTMHVRVAWCQPDVSPEYFNIGVEFKEVTPKQKDIIEAVMENYEFRRETPNYPPHPSEFDDKK